MPGEPQRLRPYTLRAQGIALADESLSGGNTITPLLANLGTYTYPLGFNIMGFSASFTGVSPIYAGTFGGSLANVWPTSILNPIICLAALNLDAPFINFQFTRGAVQATQASYFCILSGGLSYLPSFTVGGVTTGGPAILSSGSLEVMYDQNTCLHVPPQMPISMYIGFTGLSDMASFQLTMYTLPAQQ